MSNDCSYNITEAEIKEIILKAGISGVVCFSICLLSFLIGIVCLCRTKSNFILRLFLYYTLVCTLYTGTRSLYMIHYLTYDDYSDDPFCKTLGFLNCYVKLLMSIFMFSVSVLILFKVYRAQMLKQCASALRRRYCLFEAVLIFSLWIIPLLFSWIPFINDYYGREGPYCWIKNTSLCNGNQFIDMTGRIEETLLLLVPVYAATGLTCICVLLLAIRLICLLYKTGLLRSKKSIIIKELSVLLTLLVGNILFIVIVAVINGAIRSVSTQWTIDLILSPVVGVGISVLSAVYITTTWYVHRHRYKYQFLPGEPHFHPAGYMPYQTAMVTAPSSCRASLPSNTSQHAPNFLSPSDA